MRWMKLKAIDEFDKKTYPISTIDFRKKKITVHYRERLENFYDFDDLKIIQSTELIDHLHNEVYENDLLTDGINTFIIYYDTMKGRYFGKELNKPQNILPLDKLLKMNFIVVGNYFIK